MTYSDELDKAYVSPVDKFLFQFDNKHPKTASQQREIEKHRRIAKKRDEAVSNEENALWEDHA